MPREGNRGSRCRRVFDDLVGLGLDPEGDERGLVEHLRPEGDRPWSSHLYSSPMRTWVKVSLAGVALFVVGVLALAGTAGYFVFRNLDRRAATETEALREFDQIRARFPARQPLVEILNPQAGDIQINRLVHPEGRLATTLHVVTWNVDDGERLQTEIPVWLMRFSTLNVLSTLGAAPEKFSLTVQDVQRYGPGIVADYRRPGQNHVLIWAE